MIRLAMFGLISAGFISLAQVTPEFYPAPHHRFETPKGSREIFSIPACVESFPQLPDLAERLGVKPIESSKGGMALLSMCDGRKYDLIQLINALLDKMEKAK